MSRWLSTRRRSERIVPATFVPTAEPPASHCNMPGKMSLNPHQNETRTGIRWLGRSTQNGYIVKGFWGRMFHLGNTRLCLFFHNRVMISAQFALTSRL
jgi:hypothetical protein